jgi:O-antigen ligase
VTVAALWVGVAVWTAASPTLRETLTPAKEQVSLLLFYFLPLATLRGERDVRIVVAIALLVHLVVAVEVVRSGVLAGTAFHEGKRGSGPFGESWKGSDVAGGYLAQTAMLTFAFAVGAMVPLATRLASLGATAVILLGVLATYSRGSLVAVAAGLLAAVVARGIRLRTVAIVAVVVAGGVLTVPEGLRQRFNETVDDEGAFDKSTQGRLVYYRTAWQIWKDHPIGVGTGQTRAAMSQYLEKAVDTHNGFLQTLVEYGVVGIALLLVAFAVMGWSAFRTGRDPAVSWVYRAYGTGMVGLLTSLVVCNMFYSNLYKNTVLGTVAMHLGILAWINADRATPATDGDAASLHT